MIWLQFILFFIFVYLLILVLRVLYAIYIVRSVLKKTIPFTKFVGLNNNYCAVIGDSLALGIGIKDNRYTVSGRLSKDFPNFNIETYSKKGLRLNHLNYYSRILTTIFIRQKYKLIIFIVVANDIIKFSSYWNIEYYLNEVIRKFKERAEHIIILHGGNVGESPLFLPPLNWIYDKRTYKLRDIYKRTAGNYNNVYYIDLLNIKYSKEFFARDFLHANEKGVEFAYERISQTIRDKKIF